MACSRWLTSVHGSGSWHPAGLQRAPPHGGPPVHVSRAGAAGDHACACASQCQHPEVHPLRCLASAADHPQQAEPPPKSACILRPARSASLPASALGAMLGRLHAVRCLAHMLLRQLPVCRLSPHAGQPAACSASLQMATAGMGRPQRSVNASLGHLLLEPTGPSLAAAARLVPALRKRAAVARPGSAGAHEVAAVALVPGARQGAHALHPAAWVGPWLGFSPAASSWPASDLTRRGLQPTQRSWPCAVRGPEHAGRAGGPAAAKPAQAQPPGSSRLRCTLASACLQLGSTDFAAAPGGASPSALG